MLLRRCAWDRHRISPAAQSFLIFRDPGQTLAEPQARSHPPMPGDYYTEEDALGPRSPGLQPVIVDAKPQEEPPPIVTQIFVSPPSRRSNKSKRRKHRPTQGDWVLIREMAPNRPDIAHDVSQEALNSASETETSDEDMTDTKEMPAPATGLRSDSLAAANNDFNQRTKGANHMRRTHRRMDQPCTA